MRHVVVFFIIFLFSFSLPAQETADELYTSISYHSDIVANAALEKSRETAHNRLVTDLEQFLYKEGSFEIAFGNDVWLSTIMPENKEWKLITWELKREKAGSDYFGYLQMNDGSFTKLEDHSHEMEDISYLSLDASYWYGVLYYNILEQQDSKGDKYYILFGYDKHDKFTNRKVADVLSFNEGQPIFGKEVFIGNQEDSLAVQSRLFLEYGSDANVNLNYNEGLNMIVYDNLIPRMGQLPGQGPTFYPDGSYCGYKPSEEGNWTYVDKLYDQISVTPPRPKPVLGKKKKDLFGKKN